MKKYLFIYLIISILTISQLIACDVCNIFEYANRTNRSYVGVFYRQRFFNGYRDLGHQHNYDFVPQNPDNARMEHVPEGDEGTTFFRNARDYEWYQTVEIRGNYAYGRNWNFQLIVPYVASKLHYQQVWQVPNPIRDSTFNINGLGDAIVVADYAHSFYTGMIKHIVKPGIGLKLPIGMHNASSQGRTYGYDIQPGTGSFDLIARASYLVTNDHWGIDMFLNYRYCFEGVNDVQFGNKWNAMSNIYYTFKIGKMSVLPKIGGYFEHSEKDKVRGKINDFSGGYTWFYQAGADVMAGDFIIQILFQKPFSERLNGPVIGNAGRVMLGVVYNIK